MIDQDNSALAMCCKCLGKVYGFQSLDHNPHQLYHGVWGLDSGEHFALFLGDSCVHLKLRIAAPNDS